MRFFKTNKSTELVADKVANRIANGILISQEKFASILGKWTRKWKQKQKWILIYFTSLVLGGLSIISIVKPFQDIENNKSFIPKSISIPKSLPVPEKSFVITEVEYQKVQNLKNSYPGLKKENPGLYDSLLLIEEAYNSQQKK